MKNAIPIPRRLLKRPRYKGLPIPYIALIRPDDGQPDFRVTDHDKWRNVVLNRRCQLCGEPLGKWVFFVGGTEAAKHNQYFEPAAHLDCLIYAMQVCPFIVGRIEHGDVDKIAAKHQDVDIQVIKEVLPARNPWWVIKKAAHWSYLVTPDKKMLLRPVAVVKQTEPLHAETMTAADWERVTKELMQ